MIRDAKGKAQSAINEGLGFKLGSWEEEGDRSGRVHAPTWGEFLTGRLDGKGDRKLFLVKWGTTDSKYEKRALFENNSERARGSAGEWLTESEARNWLSDNEIPEDKLDKFLKVYKLISDLK